MPESPELSKDIKEMKWRLESLDNSQNLIIRADRDKYLEVVSEIFGRSKRKVEVYRHIDGVKSQATLASELGIDEGNLSRYLSDLCDGSLIEVARVQENGSPIYKKSKWHSLLNIGSWLNQKFGEATE
jgi:hypothetical protein